MRTAPLVTNEKFPHLLINRLNRRMRETNALREQQGEHSWRGSFLKLTGTRADPHLKNRTAIRYTKASGQKQVLAQKKQKEGSEL